MRKLLLATACFAISGAIFAGTSNFTFDISGSKVTTNQSTGVITVKDAEFPLMRSSALVSANQAEFVAPKKGNPSSVSLAGGARITHEGKTTIVSDATYYPELDTITGRSIQFIGPGEPVWTCQAGTIYKDNVSTGMSSMCWGSAEVSCTGSGGNRVRYISSSTNCP